MKETDTDHDGRINYEEFKEGVLVAEKRNTAGDVGAAVADMLSLKQQNKTPAPDSALIKTKTETPEAVHGSEKRGSTAEVAGILGKIIPRRESDVEVDMTSLHC